MSSNIVYKKNMNKVTTDLRNLKPSTIKQYKKSLVSILLHVYKTTLEKESEEKRNPLDLFRDVDKFFTWLKCKSINSQSIYLSAVIYHMSPRAKNVALPGFEILLDKLMLKFRDISALKFDKNTNKKTEKEEANWCSLKDLHKIRKQYKSLVYKLGYRVNSSTTLTNSKHFDIILHYVIASLYLLHNPRRNIYANTKIIKKKDFLLLSVKQKDDNNYLVDGGKYKKFFSFGSYKTDKYHGRQEIPVCSKLNTVLNLWLQLCNNTNHLLITKKGKSISDNNLCRYLNKTFEATGKKIGSNMIRKIKATEECNSDKNYKELSNAAKLFGHTVATQQSFYVKT